MASFYGTIEEFDRFLMPRIRNRVQSLTRPLKERANGVCEHCGKENGALEAAHVHGRDRKAIVREALEKYRVGDGYHIGDLDAFEREVVEAHEPVGETFLFLCRKCHRAYDALGENAVPKALAASPDAARAKAAAQAPGGVAAGSGRVRQGDMLPITLIPPDQREFKRAFIEAGVAEIREYYQDGSCKSKPWRRRGYGGFTEKSNVIGNLRSRGEYRAGTWQESGIVRIEVEVKR